MRRLSCPLFLAQQPIGLSFGSFGRRTEFRNAAQGKKDFLEAVSVFHNSARASCALLRLAIQRLCVELGKPGKNLNEDIGALVVDGLPERIRQSLDIVRVVGNNAVHPGELNVDDDPTVALSLFTLVNMITEYTITNPKRIQELHDGLPKGVQEQITKRDSPQTEGRNA